jgi:hypothetical protein
MTREGGKGRDDALSVNYHPVSFAGIIFEWGSATTAPKKPVVNDQISAIEHTPVNTLKACDGTNVSSSAPHNFFFLFAPHFAL